MREVYNMSDIRETIYFRYNVDNVPYNDSLIYTYKPALDYLINDPNLNTYTLPGNQICTLSSLSYKFYGDTGYWWILGLINGLDNLFQPLDPSLIFYYPDQSSISSYETKLVLFMSSPQYSGGTSSPNNPRSSLSNIYIGGTLVF
jgi:hypothetical protein